MQQSKPSISIITPSYNQGMFIGRTIDSVLNQKYPHLEFLVVDGNSTDSTISVLKSYGKKIQWISESDSGQTNAINKGIKKTTGSIIGYLNSDDKFTATTLESVAKIFTDNPNIQWTTGDYRIIDEHDNQIQSFVCSYKKLLRRHISFGSLSVANSIAQPSTFWRRSFLKKIGMFDESLRYCMDYDFWLRCIQQSSPFVSSGIFSEFRIHSQSKGGSQYNLQFAEELRVAARHTNNPILLLLHKMHTAAIITTYRFIK